MIRAVFFDFGGVVACLDHREMARIEQRHGLPGGGLWRAMYETPEWQALRIGQGTEEAWVGRYAGNWTRWRAALWVMVSARNGSRCGEGWTKGY